jgi:photosystem II stability/assembly factor-like uncharacterized protein
MRLSPSFSRLVRRTVCAILSIVWLWCCLPISSHAQTQPDMVWEQTSGPEGPSVVSFAVSGTNIFAETFPGGILRSTDNGASWTPVVSTGLRIDFTNQYFTLNRPFSSRILASGDNLFMITSKGVLRSTNNGTSSWTAVNLGLTNILGLAASGSTLFALTSTGIFRSTDNGNSWIPSNIRLTNTSIIFLDVSGNTVFAGASNGTVFRSTDDGVSWTAVSSGLGAGTTVESFAVSGGILFAGTSKGIFRSTDNGTSWTAVNSGLRNTFIFNLAVYGNTIFTITANGYDPALLYRSMDNGTSWIPLPLQTDYKIHSAIAVIGSTILVGSSNGISRSTDNGNTWTSANTGLRSSSVYSLGVSGNSLFATNGVFWENRVFRSMDNGNVWTNISLGLEDGYILGGSSITANGSTIFAAVERRFVGVASRVFRSVNNGASWTGATLPGVVGNPINSFAFKGDTVFAAGAGGIFRSTDNGTTWTTLNIGSTRFTVSHVAISGSAVIVSSSDLGVLRSTDNGMTWTALNLGGTILITTGSTIFVKTHVNGIYRSTDNGASWTAVNTGLTTRNVNSLLMSGKTLFAGTDMGVFRTVNNGRTWTAVNTGLMNKYVSSLAAIGNTLFAGTIGGGVFRATIPPVTPELIANPEEIALGSTPFNGSTTGATFTVIGENLSSPVSITAPSGVLLFNPATGTWGQSFTLPINADGSVEQNVAVRLDSSRAGLVGRIGATGSPAFINLMSGTTSAQVGVNGEVLPPPTSLTANPQQISLGNIILNARTTLTTFTVTGVNLPASVSITAPNGALLLNPTTGTWTQTLTLTRSSTGNIEQQISVRLDSSRLGLLGRIGNTGTPAFISVVSDTLSARVQVSGLVREAPQLVALPDSLFFGTLRLGNPPPFTLPTERRYTLVGTNLTDTLIITTPVGAQIFDSVSNSWQSTIRFPITPAPFSANLRTTLTVRIDSTRLGAISSLVQHESGLAQALVRIRGEVLPMPLLQAAPESLAFASIVQGDSVGTREYVLTGSNLPANVVVTAPDGFLLLNPATNSWVRSFTLSTSGTGSVMQRISVRMDSSLVRTFSNAAITHLSGTAAFSTQATVLVSGSIVPLTLPADAETTLELRLLTPRQPLLVRDTARVQIWLKDTRLNAPSRLHPRIIGRFLKNLRTTFKLDTNNLTVLGLRTTPATKARLETTPQTPRTTPFTRLVIERVDTSSTRELLLAEVQLLTTLGIATTNTFRIAESTLWLESATGIRWTQDTAQIQIRPVFAPPRTTQTAVKANTVMARVVPNPSAGEVELRYRLSRSAETQAQETVPLVMLITDMAGRTLQRVELGQRKTGEQQQETVSLRGLVAGTYRVVLIAPNETITGRVDILK